MIEPLRAANEIVDKKAFNWQLISEIPGKVSSSALVEFDAAVTLRDIGSLDMLVLLSSPTATFADSATPGLLRNLSRHGTVIGAVSGGVFPLKRAEISGQQKLAVHWCYRSAFEAEFSSNSSSDQVIELGDRFQTAAGAAAAFDLALHLIQEKLGVPTATEVACWFQHPLVRLDGNTQTVPMLAAKEQGNRFPTFVLEAIKLFSQNLRDPLSISRVAKQLDISERHMERAFKKSTGISPSHYYRKLRIDAARQIVLYTNDKIADVASSVGYLSVQTFTRYYKKQFGLTPLEDRQRINQFRYSGNLSVPSI